MGAALSVVVLLSVSVLVIRIASVALRITGLEKDVAKFQALSAFSGTGFTTTEAETIVNYPVRRRIVAALMIIGNVGLVSVLATLVVSFVPTAGDSSAALIQLGWLVGGLALLWLLVLNPIADRFMCAAIERLLMATTVLGKRRYHRLLQVGLGYSVCEHPAQPLLTGSGAAGLRVLFGEGVLVLGRRSSAGDFVSGPLGSGPSTAADASDQLIVYAADYQHEALSRLSTGSGR